MTKETHFDKIKKFMVGKDKVSIEEISKELSISINSVRVTFFNNKEIFIKISKGIYALKQ
jgi:phosphoribosylpyrophosphate synthetase